MLRPSTVEHCQTGPSLTLEQENPRSRPFIISTALLASASLVKVTKPNPLERPERQNHQCKRTEPGPRNDANEHHATGRQIIAGPGNTEELCSTRGCAGGETQRQSPFMPEALDQITQGAGNNLCHGP